MQLPVDVVVNHWEKELLLSWEEKRKTKHDYLRRKAKSNQSKRNEIHLLGDSEDDMMCVGWTHGGGDCVVMVMLVEEIIHKLQ